MKKIYITEQQEQIMVKESMGVPNEAIGVAKDIVNVFLENIDEMYDSVISLENEYLAENEDDEDTWGYIDKTEWEDDFVFDFYTEGMYRTYHIEVFYDSRSRKKADTDCDGEITINFAPIRRIIDKAHQMFSKNDTKWIKQYFTTNIHNYLYPVILHELTHDTDEVGGDNDHVWLTKHHRLNEEDLREILYLFSEQEINARVSSSYALMETYLEEMMVDPQMLSNKEITTQEIQGMINDVIEENEEELHISHMETLLNFIQRSDEFSDRNMLQRAEKEKFRPYSIAYDLSNNDTRLKKNRKLKQLFSQNFKSGSKYVYNFYKNILSRYKNKITRTCVKAVQDYMITTHEY